MTDVRAQLQGRPMGALQVMVVAVMTFLNGMNGYDVLAMSFAGTVLVGDWDIGVDTLGWLISAGLAGMTAGSLLIAPFADLLGRRTLILAALLLEVAGLFGSAFALGVRELAVWRIVTGFGVGAMLAAIASMTAEFANARHRTLCISIMAVGYPAGVVVGGVAAAWLVAATDDWRPVFILGGMCAAAALPLALCCPDSLEFLIERQPANALVKINRLLPRLGLAPIEQLPARRVTGGPPHEMLLRMHGQSLFLVTASYFLFAASLFFMQTWMPDMLRQAGLSPGAGISGSVLMNGGGVLGGLLFGMVAGHWGGLRNSVPVFMLLAFAAIVVFGLLPVNLASMLLVGGAIGFGPIGSVSGLYATFPVIFPSTVRATGTGIVIGAGRAGGVISPVLAGHLMAASAPRWLYCLLLALPLVIAVFLLRAVAELKR